VPSPAMAPIQPSAKTALGNAKDWHDDHARCGERDAWSRWLGTGVSFAARALERSGPSSPDTAVCRCCGEAIMAPAKPGLGRESPCGVQLDSFGREGSRS
jgi:hypothetical protein